MATPKSAPAPAPPKPSALTIDVSPSQEALQAITLRQQATALVVVDKASHTEALEFIRGAKQLKRKIEEHWSRITRNVDDLKKNLLDLKRQDLAPVEAAIASATDISLTYETADAARTKAEQDRVRREAEEKAQADRDKEQAELEKQALKAEAGSKDLSDREQRFVELVAFGLNTPETSARQAGYKDPAGQAARLLATEKIQRAIFSTKQAAEIRQQAEAKRAAPLEVNVRKVESQAGKVAGVRTTRSHSAAVENIELFMAAVLDGRIPVDYILPHQVALNAIAEKAPALFEQAFPGCKLVTKTTIAG